MTTRGVRNNNPGNIDFNPRNDWQGQIGIEATGNPPRFAVFSSPQYGIRAMAKLILNYRGKDGMPGVGGKGIDTVREVITRWAPGNENNTEAYVQAVAKAMRVQPNDPIQLANRLLLTPMVAAIIRHENGFAPYDEAVVAEGVNLALGGLRWKTNTPGG